MPNPWDRPQPAPKGNPWDRPNSPVQSDRPAGLPAGVDLPGFPSAAPVAMPSGGNILPSGFSPLHPLDNARANTQYVPADGSQSGGSRVGAAVQNFGSSTAKTLAAPIMHPVETAKGLAKLAVNPIGAGRDMGDAVVQDFEQNGAGVAIPKLLGQGAGMLLQGELGGAAVRGVKAIPGAARSVLTGDLNLPIADSGGLTPRTRYEAMRRVGTTPNAADATNSPIIKVIRRGNEGSAMGGHVYEDMHGKNTAALTDSANDLLNSMSPVDSETGGNLIRAKLQKPFLDIQNSAHDTLNALSPLEGEAAGARLQSLLKENQEGLHTAGGEQEQAIRDAYGAQPIRSLDPMRSTARTILQQNAPVDTLVPGLAQKQTRGILQDIAKIGTKRSAPKGSAFDLLNSAANPDAIPPPAIGPMKPTVGNLLDMRSRLLDVNANNPELVKGAAAADIDRQINATHEAIERSLPPAGNEAWLKANSTWRDMKETYDDPSSPFYHAVRTQNPSSLVQGVGAPTPEAVRALRLRAGDEGVGIVGRGVGSKILGRTSTGEYNVPNLGSNLERLPAEYRDELFGAQHEPLQQIAAKSRDIEPYRAAAFDTPAEKLVQGIGSPTGSEFRDLAPRIGPEGVGAIQRGVTDRLLRTDRNAQFNFPTFGRQLANVAPDYKGALFGDSPGGPAKLNDIATTANTLDFNPNRSGTGHQLQKKGEYGMLLQAPGTTAAAAFTGHPVLAAGAALGPAAYNAAQYGIARLMNSPAVVDWLMKQPAPVSGPARLPIPLPLAPKRADR